jgi:hypothetical protein
MKHGIQARKRGKKKPDFQEYCFLERNPIHSGEAIAGYPAGYISGCIATSIVTYQD